MERYSLLALHLAKSKPARQKEKGTEKKTSSAPELSLRNATKNQKMATKRARSRTKVYAREEVLPDETLSPTPGTFRLIPEQQGRRFPSRRPQSTCVDVPLDQCADTPGCTLIEDSVGRTYCRGESGVVSGLVPPGKSAVYSPVYKQGASPCQYLPESECTARSDQCSWIAPSLDRRRRGYCRGKAGTARPVSTTVATISPAIRSTFTSSGRSKGSRAYTAEEKESWFKDGNDLSEAQKKYCRCLWESTLTDIMAHGAVTRNPYGLCNASIARARSRQGEEGLPSTLARTGISGLCTTSVAFDRMPAEILYAYAQLHQSTQKGRQFFPDIPSVDEFLAAPESYRAQLLAAATRYQEAAIAQGESVPSSFMRTTTTTPRRSRKAQ